MRTRSSLLAMKRVVFLTNSRSIQLEEKPRLLDFAVRCGALEAGYLPWRLPETSRQKCRWQRRHFLVRGCGKIERRARRQSVWLKKKASGESLPCGGSIRRPAE